MKGHHGNGRNGASQNVEESQVLRNTIESLRAFAKDNPSGFGSVLLDPPWRFTNPPERWPLNTGDCTDTQP